MTFSYKVCGGGGEKKNNPALKVGRNKNKTSQIFKYKKKSNSSIDT